MRRETYDGLRKNLFWAGMTGFAFVAGALLRQAIEGYPLHLW